MTKHKIGNVDEFVEGEGKAVNVNGIEIAVFNIDGEFYAIQNLCTHYNLPLDMAGKKINNNPDSNPIGGVNHETCTVSCPWHGLEWDLDTGKNEVTNKHISTFDIEINDNSVYVLI